MEIILLIVGLFYLWVVDSGKTSRKDYKKSRSEDFGAKPISGTRMLEELLKSIEEEQANQQKKEPIRHLTRAEFLSELYKHNAAKYRDIRQLSQNKRITSELTLTDVDVSIASGLLKQRIKFERTNGIPYKKKLANNNLSPRDIVSKNEIYKLVHFTNYKNLGSILKHGLISREYLDNAKYNYQWNDKLRLDGHRNSTSLSISLPNYKMFYSYRMKERSEDWAVLEIDPSILWDYFCAFCRHNAATSTISKLKLSELYTSRSLADMFAEDNQGTRANHHLQRCDPTDVQAEVLVFGKIPISHILSINFENQRIANKFRTDYPLNGIPSKVNNDYFNKREYVRNKMSRRPAIS